ncbi:MAG: DUF3570 domain-containing protein [Marinilabiliales bacterium]|nr:DUF3570 domain-containing protein [Marinilabiliales bacterium]
MSKHVTFLVMLLFVAGWLQAQVADSTKTYRKKVLESTEVDLLMSLYQQDGVHSPVNGGIGTENLTNGTPTLVVSMPLNYNDVLTVDAGISAYTSASSSNINPFHSVPSTYKSTTITPAITGASRGGITITPPTTTGSTPTTYKTIGTPWLASTGASRHDVLKFVHADYSHSSDSRDFIWGSNVYASKEFDYVSFGLGGNVTHLFNDKNTEIGLKGSLFLDTWKPIYPTELREYMDYGSNFQNSGYFNGIKVYDQSGTATTAYLPSAFKAWNSKGRNSYTLSFFASQIMTPKLQAAFFFDLVVQQGMLSTPYHRIYFADKPNYYIGTVSDIPIYTTPDNHGVYQLADDIERLPQSRYKFPVGARLNYYINEWLVLRSYYRYYYDNWGLRAHTVSLDLPVRFSQAFSLTPSLRYYTQNQVDYFAPFEKHLSTESYYTSDYDLSKFNSMQYSLALNYTDIFGKLRVAGIGFKNANIRFSHYARNDGLDANIVSFGIKMVANP